MMQVGSRVIVVGGDGKLGAALCGMLAERRIPLIRTTRKVQAYPLGWVYLDLREPRLSGVLQAHRGTVMYIMAGISGFVPSSSNPAAWAVNAEAPVLLAQQAARAGVHVVHMSSGAVELAQETAYGRQKAHADLGVLLLGGCVVRPMSHVPSDKYSELSDLLIRAGAERRVGVVRWEG